MNDNFYGKLTTKAMRSTTAELTARSTMLKEHITQARERGDVMMLCNLSDLNDACHNELKTRGTL